jgi:osmotically-inducible protein OsmY
MNDDDKGGAARVVPGRWASALLALALGAGALGGCTGLVVGGAVVGGLMVTDRRTSGAQVEDQAIEIKAANRLRATLGERGHVNVTSYNRMALLTGEVPTEADSAAAEQAVAQVDNLQSIVNELGIGPASSVQARMNDIVLTSKVKASFIDAADLQAHAIKVVTERSQVYLLGRVTEREAKRASDVARSVPGVRKVIRVFELISEAELANLQPKPAPK